MTCEMAGPLTLQIVSRAKLDLNFQPTQANLTILYNGARVVMKVRAANIYAEVHSPECCFPLELLRTAGSSFTWGEIIEKILGEMISILTIQAVNNQLYLKHEGSYYEQ